MSNKPNMKKNRAPQTIEEFAGLFDNLEEITPKLINELRVKGVNITDEEYEFLKSEGMKYNRERGSFVSPLTSSFGDLI